ARDLHSFPTRRSSDLGPGSAEGMQAAAAEARRLADGADAAPPSPRGQDAEASRDPRQPGAAGFSADPRGAVDARAAALLEARQRSEEHTSELQSRENL